MIGRPALCAACVALLLIGCSPIRTPAAGDLTTILAVTGPEDWQPETNLSLEIGDRAWAVSRPSPFGMASLRSAAPLNVRLVRPLDCSTLASFRVQPGSTHIIRFAADGSLAVEDWTGQAVDAGPTLGARPPTRCPTQVVSVP